MNKATFKPSNEKLRELNKSFTQRQIAETLGVSRTTVSYWLNQESYKRNYMKQNAKYRDYHRKYSRRYMLLKRKSTSV